MENMKLKTTLMVVKDIENQENITMCQPLF